MVPDKITFADLHKVTQVLFEWEDRHLHDFCIPSECIHISKDEDGWGRADYEEGETLIDPFIRSYKWIRYTYDFGDDWRHKIMIEKTDPEYQERYVVLLKAKGDNFEEDSGGIWGNEKIPFDKNEVEEQLKNMEFPVNPKLQETKLLKEKRGDFEKILKNFGEVLRNKQEEKNSPMKEKINRWINFVSEKSFVQLQIVESEKTCEELLEDLGEQEINDYYKYLRLQANIWGARQDKVEAIERMFAEHPEYLLYVFEEEEYREFLQWKKLPCGEHALTVENENMIVKLLALGLGDFKIENGKGKLEFASDLDGLIKKIDAKIRKRVYCQLEDFDNKLGNLLKVYCVMELDELYKIYSSVYKENMEKEDFSRYIYWHCRFNDFVDTLYNLEGTCYVGAKEIDVQRVIERTEVYAKDLLYVSHSRKEVEYLAYDLSNLSDTVDTLFETLHYKIGMKPYDAQDWLIRLVMEVLSGYGLDEMLRELENEWGAGKNQTLEAKGYTSIWEVLVILMMEMPLPMLKGRSRLQYAEESRISPWSIDMIHESVDADNTKEKHLYEFPVEVQEMLRNADSFGDVEAIEKLLAYKDTEHICSEEFLYLTAGVCITFGRTQKLDVLLQELKKSSCQGKKLATELEERFQERCAVMDDMEYENFEDSEMDFWNWNAAEVQKPFVRENPKIGRNDPCPCGSGKKYKKCCGKGK